MSEILSPLAKARQIAKNHHEYAKEWKSRTGKKVVGYMCTYVPDEIVYAAGALPVRIFGSDDPQHRTDPHIYSMYCPFSRQVLAEALEGKYSYLDGLTKARSCMHIRNAYVSWKAHLPIEYSYFISMPTSLRSPAAPAYTAAEFADFKGSLENWLGDRITDSSLGEAIEAYNKNRKLLHRLYELRKADPPKIKGSEMMDIVISTQVMDKRESNELLEKIIREVEDRPCQIESGPRLMLVGGENDDVRFLELVESLGANIVIDDTCSGGRYFWNEVEPQEDLVKAVAKRYLERPPCPYKDHPDRVRPSFLMGLAEEYEVQGVILYHQKFCDPHEFDMPVLANMFQDKGLATLQLEFDVTIPMGQFRTRVEAFLETMLLEVF